MRVKVREKIESGQIRVCSQGILRVDGCVVHQPLSLG